VHVEEVAPPAARTALGASGDAAIDALEASEDRGLKHYLGDVCKVDRDTRTLVAREILPEQVRIAASHLHPPYCPCSRCGSNPWQLLSAGCTFVLPGSRRAWRRHPILEVAA
jgi:hypothetical protein